MRAIAAALALCAFLWSLKILLISWYLLVKHVHPLADAPVLGVVALGGADLLLCAFLAVGYRAIFAFSRRLPALAGKLVRGPGLFLLHTAIVLFSVLSFEVTRVYGWPLEVSHIRSADDPRIIAASLFASAGLLPFGLALFGVLVKPALGGALTLLLSRARWTQVRWRLWGSLALASCLMFAVWISQLRGIDTYGVKDNSLIYFAMHYHPQFRPIDAQRTMVTLASDLGDARGKLAHPASLCGARRNIPRDFPLAAKPEDGRGMNVLVIQLESTSAAYIDATTTPNLMRLAQHGLSFKNHATVFSETSRASYGIYFSDYLTDLGTTPRLLYQRPMPRTSLAAVLRNAGYDTAAFHSGFLSYADLHYLFEHTGFDTVVDATNLWSGESELPWSWGVREEQTVEALVHWLQQPRSKPFFAIYATEFPHHPYVCPIKDKPYPDTSWQNRYRNSLHYADQCVGQLLDHMAEMKLLDNTLIVAVGDHGETVSTYPVGHGVAMTREELFTPFILSNPRLFPQPVESRIVTNHLDIAPTITRLVDLPAPTEWLGRDLTDEQIPSRLLFVQAKLAQVHGVLDNGLVYVLEAGRKRAKLYDTSGGGFDPVPLADSRTPLMAQYREQDDLFQKWAVWRHMARATGHDEALTLVAMPPVDSAAAQPAAASQPPAAAAP